VVRLVVTDGSGGAAQLVEHWDSNQKVKNCKGWCRPRIRPTIFSFTGQKNVKLHLIKRLWNLDTTPDVVVCRMSLRKTYNNAILGPSSLPTVMAQY